MGKAKYEKTNLEPVDVVVCTYNSAIFLEACLKSICENIPVHNLFVVDKLSRNGTMGIALSYGARIIQFEGSLAEARQVGFRHAETPFVVNVDSDVVLCKDWFRKVMRYWGKDVGSVGGITVEQLEPHRSYQLAMYRFRRPESYNIFHLPNIVIKRDLVDDIEFPNPLKLGSVASEDYWIKSWIERKGFRCVNAPVFVKHYSYPSRLGKKTFWFGSSARLMQRVSFKRMVLQTLLSLPQALYACLMSRNARVVLYWIRFRFEELVGWLQWNKYVVLRRGVLN